MSGDDRVRGFPAFPPGRRARTSRSWWGDAWIRALEDTSLDQTLLRRGRRSASAGHVGSITVSPGRIAAEVHDGVRDLPYRTRVFVEPMTDAQWSRFSDQVAAKAGHIAALLDGEMPRDLASSADDAGIALLPGLGDLQPECDCPEWAAAACRHAAALCYQVAWLLDADPFLLLLIRGRGAREVLAELRRRAHRPAAAPPSAAPAGRPGAGVPAARAYARPDPPLPAPPPPPESGVPGPALPDAPGIAAEVLRGLVDNAAVRAAALLRVAPDGDGPPPALPERVDAVRLAVGAGGPVLARLRRAGGRTAREFSRAVRAWEYGGHAGLSVLDEPWTPPPVRVARARADLTAGWAGDDPPEPQVWRNRWTFPRHRAQLRYGRDGRWYPYRERADGDWWPAGVPRDDPADALADLLGD
ncbi:SWIM zinc finger family protein [Plantactinospora sp. CA-294935]|uniref:SWIM zinc finger family protein n=1 Tax=Plantactinospora sp. CA-294935 TaxID=3240012 RepID=UPI003D8CD183